MGGPPKYFDSDFAVWSLNLSLASYECDGFLQNIRLDELTILMDNLNVGCHVKILAEVNFSFAFACLRSTEPIVP